MPAWSGGIVFPTWFPDIVTCGARRGAAPGGGVGVTLDLQHAEHASWGQPRSPTAYAKPAGPPTVPTWPVRMPCRSATEVAAARELGVGVVLAEDPHAAGGVRGRRLKSAFPLAGLVAAPAAVRPVRSALICQSRAAAAWS